MDAVVKRKVGVVENLPTKCTHCGTALTKEMTVEIKTGIFSSFFLVSMF